MKKDWIYIILLIVLAVVLCMPVKSLFSENDDDEESQITHVTLAEDGEEYTIPAIEGQVIVMFREDVTEDLVREILADNDIQVISKLEQLNYYLLGVQPGDEGKLITRLQSCQEVGFVGPDVLETLLSVQPCVIDGFVGDHGGRVKEMLEESCSNLYVNTYDVSKDNGKSISSNKVDDALYRILSNMSSSESVVINMSFGPRLENSQGARASGWSDPDANRSAYRYQYRCSMQRLVKIASRYDNLDFVITKSSGNDGMKHMEEIVADIQQYLSPEENRVFERHFMIVSAKDDYCSSDYSNDVAPGVTNPMVVKVDISDKTAQSPSWQGTSFSSPRFAGCIANAANALNLKVVDVLSYARLANTKTSNGVISCDQIYSESDREKEKRFTSPDLKWKQVHGRVKQVEYIGEYNYNAYFNFNREGRYVSYNDTYDEKSTYKRDKKGRIIEWTVTVDYHVLYVEEYTYNKDGYIYKESNGDDEEGDDLIYVLNDKGWPVSATCKTWYVGDEGYEKSTISYSYPKIDDHGNWLVCVVKRVGRDLYENKPFSRKTTITRKITYWE